MPLEETEGAQPPIEASYVSWSTTRISGNDGGENFLAYLKNHVYSVKRSVNRGCSKE
jgi:hypothetical protein